MNRHLHLDKISKKKKQLVMSKWGLYPMYLLFKHFLQVKEPQEKGVPQYLPVFYLYLSHFILQFRSHVEKMPKFIFLRLRWFKSVLSDLPDFDHDAVCTIFMYLTRKMKTHLSYLTIKCKCINISSYNLFPHIWLKWLCFTTKWSDCDFWWWHYCWNSN